MIKSMILNLGADIKKRSILRTSENSKLTSDNEWKTIQVDRVVSDNIIDVRRGHVLERHEVGFAVVVNSSIALRVCTYRDLVIRHNNFSSVDSDTSTSGDTSSSEDGGAGGKVISISDDLITAGTRVVRV